MTDPQRPRAVASAAALGVLLALAAAVGGVPGAVCAALAQPAFALAVSWWRRTRPVLPLPQVARQDAPALLALWSLGPLLLTLLVAWPLGALHDSGSLAAVLGLSVAVSAALLGVWRTWPLWNDVERSEGSLARHWQTLAGRDLTALVVGPTELGADDLETAPAGATRPVFGRLAIGVATRRGIVGLDQVVDRPGRVRDVARGHQLAGGAG